MKYTCPICSKVHYYTNPYKSRKRWGICCSQVCFERHAKQERENFLNDLPPDTNVHQEGGLIVIGVKPTRKDLLELE
jgi:hypothetical protein